MSREGPERQDMGSRSIAITERETEEMLKALKQRRESEEGFTLIELMVVVLIIAILLAIAIPTFLGAQNRAKDRSAQSDLRNSLTAAKTLATDQEGYFRTSTAAQITPADMDNAESSLDHAAVATVDVIGVNVYDAPTAVGERLLLTKVSKAKGNPAWAIYAHQDGTVGFCKANNNTTDGGATNAAALQALTYVTVNTCAGTSFGNATDLG